MSLTSKDRGTRKVLNFPVGRPIGNNPKNWRTGIPTYGRVLYKNVYANIDLAYYGNQGQLEYDFVLEPGADPKAIRLSFEGGGMLKLDAQGGLTLGEQTAGSASGSPDSTRRSTAGNIESLVGMSFKGRVR